MNVAIKINTGRAVPLRLRLAALQPRMLCKLAAFRPIISSSSSNGSSTKPPPQQQQGHVVEVGGVILPMAVSVVHLVAAGSAAAAKIEVDVPDFLVENNPVDVVLHSPVFAIGAAVLALILFPKLIKTTINYLFYPAIVALLAYLAISHPEETANSIYFLLEFIKDHPGASSIAIIAAAGVLLGPDVLAGTAVAGVLLLLAAQAGVLQLPKLPELPRLPGQQLVTKQLDRAGRAVKEKVEQLDEGKPLVPAAAWNKQRQRGGDDGGSRSKYNSGSSGSSSSSRAVEEYMEGRDGEEDDKSSRYGLRMLQQEERMLQQEEREARLGHMQTWQPEQQQPGAPKRAQDPTTQQQQLGSAALKAIQNAGKQVGAVGKGLVEQARDVLPEQQQLQAGLQKAGKGLGSAAKDLGSMVQGLGDKVQQSRLGSRVESLTERAGAAAAGALGKLQQGLKQAGQLRLPATTSVQEGSVQQQQQQLAVAQQKLQQQEVAAADVAAVAGSVNMTAQEPPAAAAAVDGHSSRIDSILANS